MIDLNNDQFDGGGNVSIINNGKAGEVVVKPVKVEKKTDDGNNPDYKIFFEDESGAQVNEGFYYVDLTRQYGENALKTQGTRLKHYCKAIIPNWEIPKFETPKEMLDTITEQLRNAINSGNASKIRLGVSYGTTSKSSNYLGVKRTVPFALAENSTSEITFSDLDVTEKPQPDTPANNAAGASNNAAGAAAPGW